jgi:hypothetical protein
LLFSYLVKNRMKFIWQLGVTLGIVVVGANMLGHAQGRPTRRGAPRDWSHSRLLASRFGPDLDRNIAKDWRTYNKHVRRDQALAAVRAEEPLIDWFGELMKKLAPPKPKAAAAPHLDWYLNTGGYAAVVGDPAKYSFDITSANCADVIYYTVNQAGGAATPNVIAITNPYSICPGNAGGTTPTVKWALRMTAGTATSAVPSLDGTVLYVLESRAASTILHAVNVNNITTNTGNYDFPSGVWSNVHTLSSSPIGTPTSEQLFEITFATAVNNVSSPYLDYSGYQIFFGDAAGKVHRVINTHLATASEYVSNGFPVACGAAQLTSPVFVNNQVLVSSANGFLYRIDLSLAPPYASIRSVQGGTGVGAEGGLSAPVVDITNNKIIIASGKAFLGPVKGIGAVNLMFAANEAQTSGVALGASDGFAATTPTFDDTFWSTNNGFAYATGSPSGGGNTYLIKIPYNGDFAAATGFAALRHTGAAIGTQTTAVTEFLTASAQANKDFIFVGASGGTYDYMNRLSAGFGGTDAAPVGIAGSFAAPGGVSSGIVIDTRTSYQITTGLSTANIYYGTKGIAGTTQSRIVQLNQEF